MSSPTLEEDLGLDAPWPINWLCLAVLMVACAVAWVYAKLFQERA